MLAIADEKIGVIERGYAFKCLLRLGGLVMSNIENVGPIDPTEKTSPIQNERGTFIYLGNGSRDARS
jgi:hypothetical protein